jgi:hypothetical protein
LEALLEAEPDFDAVAFCSDVVDYGPCPIECVGWLQDYASHSPLALAANQQDEWGAVWDPLTSDNLDNATSTNAT